MSNDTTRTSGKQKPDGDKVKVNIKGGWTAVPNRLLKDQRLSRDARLLGSLIFMHAANSGKAFPSQEDLAEELSFTAWVPVTDPETGKGLKDPATGQPLVEEVRRTISVRSVQRWLGELKEAGWLEWQQTVKNNLYTLYDPYEIDVAVQPQERVNQPDSSHNDSLTSTTLLSPSTTAVSPSTTTLLSPSTTAVSPSTISKKTHSIKTHDIKTHHHQEAASEHDDDGHRSSQDARKNLHAPTNNASAAHTPASLYLAEKGIETALEFRELPLQEVERVWYTVMGRDPNARPGAVVTALRGMMARQAQATSPPVATAANSTQDDVAIDSMAVEAQGGAPLTLQGLWQAALEQLQLQMSRQEYDTRLRDASLLALDGGIAMIGVGSPAQKEGVENRDMAAVRRVLCDLTGTSVQVRVVLRAAGTRAR